MSPPLSSKKDSASPCSESSRSRMSRSLIATTPCLKTRTPWAVKASATLGYATASVTGISCPQAYSNPYTLPRGSQVVADSDTRYSEHGCWSSASRADGTTR